MLEDNVINNTELPDSELDHSGFEMDSNELIDATSQGLDIQFLDPMNQITTLDHGLVIDSVNPYIDNSSVELINSIKAIDYESINSAESFFHHYRGGLSLEDVQDAIQNASDFFNMESPQVVTEGWTTGVFNRDLTTVRDDVLVFNLDQLEEMGITERDGLDLVITHENTHRALQSLDTHFSDHQEELCCDYMAGVRAGLNAIDTTQMAESLVNNPESLTHPAGTLRVEAIQEGYEYAQSYFAEFGHSPTFLDCLEHFSESGAFQLTTDPMTIVSNPQAGSEEFHGYTQADVDYYEHQARISSGAEQARWLKEAKWARDHIRGFVDDSSLNKAHHFNRGEYGNATGDYIDDSHPHSDL